MNYQIKRHKFIYTFELLIFTLLVVCQCDGVTVMRSNLPGPLVYVVTPAYGSNTFDDAPVRGRPYYSNPWRRMDEEVTTTTEKPKQTNETPDLIFAEFESDDGKKGGQIKSIRKLLEREKVKSPVDVKVEQSTSAFIINVPPTEAETTTTTSTTSTTPATMNVEDIWHIINREQEDEDVGWKKVSIPSQSPTELPKEMYLDQPVYQPKDTVNDTIFYPGFKTQKVIEGDNESRAIRTDYRPKIRFPYIDLNTLQSNNKKKGIQGNKNQNNLFTNLESYQNENSPLKGEAHDVNYRFPQVDRYNPAQPYLPPVSKPDKQSFVPTVGPKLVQADNLVPPPPPPPKTSFVNPPRTYESFPPFGPSSNQLSAPAPSFLPPVGSNPPRPSEFDNDAPPDMADFNGYTYNSPPSFDMGSPTPDKPPKDQPSLDFGGYQSNPPKQEPAKPDFGGYQYNPPKQEPAKPDPGGYQYNPPKQEPAKPDFGGYQYNPPKQESAKPDFDGYHYKPPQQQSAKPDFGGYHYSPPAPSADSKPPMNDKDPPEDETPSFQHSHVYEKPYGYHHDHPHAVADEYPELIYDKKPASGVDMVSMADMADDMGGKDPMKDLGMSDSGMPDEGMPPPPPPDHGGPEAKFPDFTFDKPPFDDHHFKYHDFEEDHDFHHHHHHHTTTTTTTTTEMPRVNRFSYYYLGKKLYYLPLYFSVYFTAYVAALIIKSILRHKITYPQHFQNVSTRSLDSLKSKLDLSSEQLHEISSVVTNGLIRAAQSYMEVKK